MADAATDRGPEAAEADTEAAAALSADAPLAGFFGKTRHTGDFVSRGLPDGFRARWDLWVTRHLAPRQLADGPWPEGGLRFRLVSGGRVAAGVVLPSADRVGRRFPLSLLLIAAELPAPAALEGWCDAAAALDTDQPADELWAALADLAVPSGSAAPDPLVIWTRGAPPRAADPAAPASALDDLWPGAAAAD